MNKCFSKITNEDILLEIRGLREDINKMKIDITLNRWIATTALTIIFAIAGAMILI